jgi:hypothetical protein
MQPGLNAHAGGTRRNQEEEREMIGRRKKKKPYIQFFLGAWTDTAATWANLTAFLLPCYSLTYFICTLSDFYLYLAAMSI